MPNVTFKFVITQEVFPTEVGGRRQIIASISDDNAKRIMDLTGLASEVEALKDHCHRMLNLARNRFLGYCDQAASTAAIMAECQTMGMDQPSAPVAAEAMPQRKAAGDVCYICGKPRSAHTQAAGGFQTRGVCPPPDDAEVIAALREEVGRLAKTLECSRTRVQEMGDVNVRLIEQRDQLKQALAESGALVQTTSLHEQAARAEMQKMLAQNHDLKIAVQAYGEQRDEANRCMAVASGKAVLATKERDEARTERDALKARNKALEEREDAFLLDPVHAELNNARTLTEATRQDLVTAHAERDAIKTTAADALIALKHEWPQQALWRAQSPEAEPIRRLAAAVGVELAP